MSHRVYGIRHHGPGSARSLAAALARWQPDCVLVEGPPDANELLPLVADAQMQPPVAILGYLAERATTSVFYPFAAFSPEWVAMRWALANAAVLRFIDLPLSLQLADAEEEEDSSASDGKAQPVEAGEEGAGDQAPAQPDSRSAEETAWRELCTAGGFADSEALWDRLVESRPDAADGDSEPLFDAVQELMAELRRDVPDPDGRELRREAYMRGEIRRALKEGHERIAVVCGAWHAPALRDVSKGVGADAAALKGLAKCKVATTWIPWSFGRLTRTSGYGAGVSSPGWYSHLHARPAGGIARWLAESARVFRGHDLDVAPSHVIEAVRLADTLATVRGFPEPSLAECLESMQAIFCNGDPGPMEFLARELLVGERMGTVPDSVPEPALSADLRAEQKRLRMKVEASQRTLDLDLRNENDLERSRLLHRLNILRVHWGQPQGEPRRARAKNTFHELWTLAWSPENALALIEAGRFGNTVERAANAALVEASAAATTIPQVASLLEQALNADCGDSVPALSLKLDALAAGSNDVPGLMVALAQLAPVLRYGDVRRTDVASLRVMLVHYAERVCIGLPLAASNISDELADQIAPMLAGCEQAMRLLASEEIDIGEDWQRTLRMLAGSGATHSLLAGRAVRLLIGRDALAAEEAAQLLSQALSPGVAAAQARWLEGVLAEGGLFLIHDPRLLTLLDDWLRALPADQFESTLPIARRAFSALSKPERRQIGQLVVAPGSPPQAAAADADFDWSRSPALVSLLQRYLKLEAIE
jgi:hypothetical protein